MRTRNRSNALLVELLIVIMFFMLASTLLIQIFAAARSQSARAEAITLSLAEAQNVADRLYASKDAEGLLEELGFVREGTGWILERDGYRIEALTDEEPDDSGVFHRQEVRVSTDNETLFTLPCSRWEGRSE